MGRKIVRTKQNRTRQRQEVLDNIIVESEARRTYGNGSARRHVAHVKPKNETQEDYMASILTDDIVFGLGPAGTGKTYIAVCLALDMLKDKKVAKLVLSRPAVEAEGEKLGYLPGDLNAKIAPYLIPIHDVLVERLGAANTKRFMDDGIIELCPLGFMRGRTFTNALIILDEMQNASPGQFKMALTRVGEMTRVIVTGDPDQSDLELGKSGLLDTAAKLEGTPGIEIIRFDKTEVVRSAVVRKVLEKL